MWCKSMSSDSPRWSTCTRLCEFSFLPWVAPWKDCIHSSEQRPGLALLQGFVGWVRLEGGVCHRGCARASSGRMRSFPCDSSSFLTYRALDPFSSHPISCQFQGSLTPHPQKMAGHFWEAAVKTRQEWCWDFPPLCRIQNPDFGHCHFTITQTHETKTRIDFPKPSASSFSLMNYHRNQMGSYYYLFF